MTRFLDNMKLSALATAIAFAAMASAQESGGSSSAASAGAAQQAAEAAELKELAPLFAKLHKMTMAHGTIMCLAFVIFFPAGSFVIRLGKFKGAIYVHAAIQMFAYMMAIAGMGMGSWIAHAPKKLGRRTLFHEYHPIIGYTIIAALVFQPALGALHHAVYVREGRRSIWSYLHVWWGRIVLTLAIIQGGLGLRFANNTHGGKIAYGVVAGLVWISWLGVAVWHDTKKAKTQTVVEKRSDSEEMTPIGG
ncbi:hypothetical protein IMSHALPRED_002945 [Imshaugia aleurites]|uniref:Cytochrome b561 domain-containing protein n=1 Tax=Imshaugia aleurites TaxID=172621 RepID=A0A8H3F0T8_9LECA|nr:hypothetical protein IMSHALPRED_002945 [Imshaugia aleurites]